MNREEFLRHAEERFGELPDCPFEDDCDTTVLRHSGNRKWFALVMNIPKNKLVPESTGNVDVVNLKCAPEVADSFRHEHGIYPAYHMNKRHWISVLLDGSVSADKLDFLLGVSHELTRTKIRGRRGK